MTQRLVSAVPAAVGAPRRAYIDWLRGVAVFFMVLWHAVDAWHETGNRGTAAFGVVAFLAGWAAPMFLFLAGVSLPMAGLSRMARGADRRTAGRLLVRRGWQVFLLAHLFRVQSFVLNPNAGWDVLFKPDILNVLGLGMVMVGFAWRRATTPRARVVWLLLPAVVVAGVLTPWIPAWWWPSQLPSRLEGYIRIINGNAVFSLCPAVAYVFAGAFAGSVLAERTEAEEAPFHRVAAALGVLLVVVDRAWALVAWPTAFAWWTTTLVVVAGRVGAMLVMMAVAWQLLRLRAPRAWSPLMVFGQTSLFVYWVHVELVYGRFSYPIHRSLSLAWALSAYGAFMLALYAASRIWLRRPAKQPLIPPHMVANSDVKSCVSAG